MPRIRITGLVSLADQVRQNLVAPRSKQQIAECQRAVQQSLETVNGILARNNAKVADLPAPSRKAYRFLNEFDFEAVHVVSDQPTKQPSRQVRFHGLRRLLETFLEWLAIADRSEAESIASQIRTQSEWFEHDLKRRRVEPDQLTDETRNIRGWLAFFSDAENVCAYIDAMDRARSELAPEVSDESSEPTIEFRPMKSLYRVRDSGRSTHVSLPTPMICCNEQHFKALAGIVSRRHRNKGVLLEAMTGDECQSVQAELEALGGVVEQTAGIVHDLAESFDRVNARYFAGKMARPRLTWSRRLTHRKFGHYDPVRDTVMLSSSLDHDDVPAFVVDFVMYHELLHKKHGMSWRQGRLEVHSPEFRKAERRFEKFDEAERVLDRLAAKP